LVVSRRCRRGHRGAVEVRRRAHGALLCDSIVFGGIA
jgi:hypothetical protein